MSRAVARRLNRLEGTMGGGERQVFVIYLWDDQAVDDAVRDLRLTPGPDDHVVGVAFIAAQNGKPALVGRGDRSWLPG
jgi:hypothetical protein